MASKAAPCFLHTNLLPLTEMQDIRFLFWIVGGIIFTKEFFSQTEDNRA